MTKSRERLNMPCSFEREPIAPSICREFRGNRQTLKTDHLGGFRWLSNPQPSPVSTRFAQWLSEVARNKRFTTPAVRLASSAGRGLKQAERRVCCECVFRCSPLH